MEGCTNCVPKSGEGGLVVNYGGADTKVEIRFEDDPVRFEVPKSAPVAHRRPLVRTYVKYRRNKPCPCGSTKKFKKCCLDIFPVEYTNLATDGLRRE